MAVRKKTTVKTPAVEKTRMNDAAFFAIVIVVAIIFIGGSIFVGMRDSGQINVTGTLTAASDENIANGETSSAAPIPNAALRTMPNGGLVPSENQDTSPQALQEPESTATGTDATSTVLQDESNNSDTPIESESAPEESSPAQDTVDESATDADFLSDPQVN